MTKLKVLDIFSGIGGFSLGLERTGGFKTVAFCEIEPFSRRVLAKHWPDVTCHKDVRKLNASNVGPIDLICGGYPCQPFSLAGQRRGAEDDRHLWPEMLRLVASCRPRWVIAENVAGHISLGLDGVLSNLEGENYTCRAFIIPACAIDAPHRRDRVWIVAHDDSQQRCADERKPVTRPNGGYDFIGIRENVSYAPGPRQSDSRWREAGAERAGDSATNHPSRKNGRPRAWPAEPKIRRVVNGVPGGLDRLRGLGNAVVPQIPEMIGYAILESEKK